MTELDIAIVKSIAEAGLPAMLMAAAVYWLQRSNTKLVNQLNAERSERLDAMEQHVKDCDTDRKELRDMLLRHLGQTHDQRPPHHLPG